ncbi:MAG: hypothetical protein RQ867_09875 [Mariprofundaceae bacterium]|nr:hypothetical protein [Mariprofundaceae bacterium]
MQKDLDKLWKRKRQINRLLAVLSLTIIAALLVVGVRTCSDHFQEPYNKDYRPVDNVNQKPMEPGR